MITYLHFRTFFVKKHLFLALIFRNLLYLFCLKLFSLSEIILTYDEHVFIRILVTNLCVLCFDIYAIIAMCTPIFRVDSILYQKFALWTYSPIRHKVSPLYFSPNNLLRVLTCVCRHCNINVFNLNKHSFFYLSLRNEWLRNGHIQTPRK